MGSSLNFPFKGAEPDEFERLMSIVRMGGQRLLRPIADFVESRGSPRIASRERDDLRSPALSRGSHYFRWYSQCVYTHEHRIRPSTSRYR